MLRDNLVELIEPMPNSAGADPLALGIHEQKQASDDRLSFLENPRPEGAESSLAENVTSPFQTEPLQSHCPILPVPGPCALLLPLATSTSHNRRAWILRYLRPDSPLVHVMFAGRLKETKQTPRPEAKQ
jgi:hypothetical protein